MGLIRRMRTPRCPRHHVRRAAIAGHVPISPPHGSRCILRATVTDMQHSVRFLIAVILAGLAVMVVSQTAVAAPGPVRGVVLDASIDPASAQFVVRRIDDAVDADASVFIIEMDTPGGLVTSMKDIVKAIEGSPVPVVVWVGPSGSRAGSAGAYISASSDLLLMAPGTNIGSATPVGGAGEDLDDKIVNDAAAQITALAESHDRNGAAYRAMVTEQANYTATEAVSLSVADGIAESREAVLSTIDGTTLDGVLVELDRTDVDIEEMPWYLRLLQVLTDPNVIAILFGLGIAAIGYEIFNPGGIVPGVFGVIAVLLSFLGLSVVPFNWAGLAFIGLAFILFALEAVVSGFGVLAIGGVVSLVIGGLVLFDEAEGPVVSRPGLIISSVILGGAFTLLARSAWRAQRSPQTTGSHSIVGHTGEARSTITHDGGSVFVNGELWAARSSSGTIPQHALVRVTDIHELTLVVERTSEE